MPFVVKMLNIKNNIKGISGKYLSIILSSLSEKIFLINSEIVLISKERRKNDILIELAIFRAFSAFHSGKNIEYTKSLAKNVNMKATKDKAVIA